jgi:hypothetical protein
MHCWRAARRFVAAAGCALALCGAGAGCATQYRQFVAPLPERPVPPSLIEVGAFSVSKKKAGLFHQPCISENEMEGLAQAALRQVPRAEFFSDHRINAVLRIYPSARLPIWYSLKCELSGMAARTNLIGAAGSERRLDR